MMAEDPANQVRLPLREAYPYLESNGLAEEAAQIKNSKLRWKSYSATVRRGLVAELMKDKNLLEKFSEQFWPFGITDKGKREVDRYLRILEKARDDPDAPDYAPASEEEPEGSGFVLEAHLRDFLAKNLDVLEKGLTLWPVGGDASAVEFPVGEDRRIDILARDAGARPVVIELKVSRGHEKTIGQALYYRAEIKKLFNVNAVRIIIVAREISPELSAAVGEVSDVLLFEYSISMKVNKKYP
jgi:hypothetical protein